MVKVETVQTKPFQGQKPGTSGLRKRVPEFQQEHYTENFIQAVLDGGLGFKKKGRHPCRWRRWKILVQRSCKRHNQNCSCKRGIIGQNGFLSTPAVSNLIRKGFEGKKIDGGIILTASHNPGGPKADFGIKFNCENGGPAPDAVTNAIYTITTQISTYSICPDLQCDFSQIGTSEFDVENVGHFVVDVIDSVKDYIKSLISGELTGKRFEVLIDSMHGATGPYVSTILCDHLGVQPRGLLRTNPKPGLWRWPP
ncbi:phosphoglucomutase/phosphomannomutase, alpha/beta/alpha domain I [Ostertagia ostertagi]